MLMTSSVERVSKKRQLAVAADETRIGTPGNVDPVARPSLERLPRTDSLRLALRRDPFHFAIIDRSLGREVGGLAGEDAVDRGGRLEPGSGIHDVPCRHSLSREGTRAE